MSEQLKHQSSLSSHIVPLLLKFKNICNLPPNTSNATKIAQFDKGMRKIWGVQRKGVQCSMMGESKQIKILSLKFFIVASLLLDYKAVLLSIGWHTHHHLNCSK
jgi:hypothetical protein